MGSLRIISDNAVDRAALTASSTAGALVVANLKTDKKSDVWRATGAAARLTLAWPAPEAIGGVALPFCDLSPAATWRVRVSSEPAKANLLTYSEAFGDSSWEKIGMSLNGGQLAPDGTSTATAITASGADPYMSKSLTLAAGTHTFSVFLRGVGGTVGKTPNVWIWNINNLAGFSSAVDVRPLAGGWVRYAATCNVTTAGTYRVRVDAPDVAATNDVVHAWGAQMERGSLSSYYPSGAASATRPAGYIDGWQGYDYDSGQVLACPAPAIKLRGWTAAASMSAYAYGGGACARHWLPTAVPALCMVIDIADPDNLQGYIEAARLVAGEVWAPTYGASSAAETFVDATEHYETAAGDLLSRASTIRREVPIELRSMPPADRARLADILRASRAYPIFLSVFAGHADLDVERAHTVFGKRASDSEVEVQAAMRYGTKITVRSI